MQSPRAKTLGNLLCCRVCLLTSTQPSEFANGLALMMSGADIGGVTCRKSYCDWNKTTTGFWHQHPRDLPKASYLSLIHI